jgi:hypothetical protein
MARGYPSGDQDREQQLFNEMLDRYSAAICTAEELEKIEIIPRKPLMGKWMKEGDSGFIYGERGSGKTWFVDAIATCLSSGRSLGDWEVPEAINVLLVDGEMPGDEARARIKGMSPANKQLYLLHHEILFDRYGW